MSTALYRRYRPETFTEVIGQNHVTDPLMAALRANRVTHAYLFSGPRGCGKTTSARILARCLNCEQGPTDTPCGECESCRELATGGPGSLDVVEIDAASHNGVDDARELRERATFAPVRDRYKVFILDEAHMVTPQGFNALLKLVEEPPEHVKFIFATTEPERVIGTIRSRTHHYPFRLVPGEVMVPFLEGLCRRESISMGEGVLPLVVRAGGGSVRDSLSVLDQLMAGGQDGEVSYQRAVSLLGYTDSSLIDDVVDALAESDGVKVFATVEHMVEAGHDPRRFVEDFLQRLRDLLIITVTGDGARDFLVGIPHDQHERMFTQAQGWGGARLSRAADITDQALRQMVGATSPRLQLELLMGRLLVMEQTATSVSTPARSQAGGNSRIPADGTGRAGDNAVAGHVDAPARTSGSTGLSGAAMAREELRRMRLAREQEDNGRNEGDAGAALATPTAPASPTSQPPTTNTATRASEAESPTQAPGQREIAAISGVVGQRWEQFLDTVEQLKRGWRKPIAANVHWTAEDEGSLTVVFAQEAMRDSFIARGNLAVFQEAVRMMTGTTKEIVALGPNDVPPSGISQPATDQPAASSTPPAQASRQAIPVPQAHPASEANPTVQTSPGSAPGWGPIAVAGGGMNQDLTPTSAEPAHTDSAPADDGSSPARAGDTASSVAAESAAENAAKEEAAEAQLAANVAAQQGEENVDISLSVKPAPPSEEIEDRQPGAALDMGSNRGEPTAATETPQEPSTRQFEAAQHPGTPSEDEPAISDEPPEYDDPYHDDPTGGASLDDADAEPVMEVGLPVIERVFNVTHFEEITEEE